MMPWAWTMGFIQVAKVGQVPPILQRGEGEGREAQRW